MLTHYIQPKLIEKVLTNKAGEQFRVVFAVVLRGGHIDAKVVLVEPLSKKVEDVLCLPEKIEQAVAEYTYKPSFNDVPSPYNPQLFLISQPTRAPSIKRE